MSGTDDILFKIQDMIDKSLAFLKHLPETIKKSPIDEKAAYGSIGLGIVFLFVGLVLALVS
ncbi:MAG TPA: hypothetical protein VJI75_05260 [Candidatus Nanoarchaeia archaeon]|nr:hypothetical protein [Candidatus Nanoarchaeia archaeon]